MGFFSDTKLFAQSVAGSVSTSLGEDAYYQNRNGVGVLIKVIPEKTELVYERLLGGQAEEGKRKFYVIGGQVGFPPAGNNPNTNDSLFYPVSGFSGFSGFSGYNPAYYSVIKVTADAVNAGYSLETVYHHMQKIGKV